MTMATQEEMKELLTRGVAELVDPDGSFQKKLLNNPGKVVIKLGVDPTRPDIHLGHAVILRKLRKFQDLGCKVIFLIGDYTAQIGDPTGKSKVRPEIEQAEVEKNAKTYIDQVGKILNVDPKVFAWIRNSDWFYGPTDLSPDPGIKSIDLDIKRPDGESTKINLKPDSFLGKSIYYENTRMQRTHFHNSQIVSVTLRGLLWTMKHITHARLIERAMFQDRLKKGEELYMHEMLYPVLQGVDSFALASIFGSCDLEVGGTDQTFNMLIGRDVMKANGKEPQAVISFDVLEGLDGKEKMSKSLDNYIAINDEPNDMYGKVMSVPDSLITKYFTLCTYTPLSVIEEMDSDLKQQKGNPRDLKMRLAKEIVEMYHGREKALSAEQTFVHTFSKGGIPEGVPEVSVKEGGLLVDVLLDQHIVPSKTEFRRLVDSRAIEHMESKKGIDSYEETIQKTGTYRIGKKRFIKVIVG